MKTLLSQNNYALQQGETLRKRIYYLVYFTFIILSRLRCYYDLVEFTTSSKYCFCGVFLMHAATGEHQLNRCVNNKLVAN